jgi:ligand-binding sensor domain-containing protein/signal transduction histidine kinase
MKLRKLLTVFFLLACLINTSGQEYSYARYDVKDGLAGSVVYHGVEDKDGFLWFATETGVSRFDGTHFKNFTKQDGLPDNEILKLFVDSKGRVWMMPFRNTICYYWKGKIYNQENDSLLKKMAIVDRIIDIMEDRQGNLIFASPASFFLLNTFQEIKTTSAINGLPYVFGATGLTNAGHIMAYLVLYTEGIFFMVFDKQGKVLSKESLPGSTLNAMSRQSSYLSDRVRIHKAFDSLVFETNAGQTKRSLKIPPAFNNLSVSGDTLCSINTGNGSIFYDIRSGKIIRQALSGTIVNSTFQDSEGNWWFLTAGAGIYRIGSFEFSNYTFSENNKNPRSVFSIYKSDSLLYVGSEKTLLFTIDLSQQAVRHRYLFTIPMNARVLSFVPAQHGRLFMGTDLGIAELNSSIVRTETTISIKSLKKDGDSLLVAAEHGLILFAKDGSYTSLYNKGGVRTTCAYVQNKLYYIGTLNGVYVMDSRRQVSWLGDKHTILQGRITDIEEGPDSTLWITTHGEGIVGYKNGKVTHSIRQQDGLTSDICRNVFIAGNDVWVGTDRGLNRVRLREKEKQYQIITFTSTDGLLADIINAIYIENSQVYVGTPAGLTSFDANKISLNSSCKLRLTGIQAANTSWAHDTTGFILPPADNAIRFDYVGISYRSAGDITYRYRLVGLNDNWQITRETFLSYPALPSGDYELQLIATNKFGMESEMIRIPFLVKKQLWEKTWFRILILLIAGSLIWIFVNTRIRKIRRQNDEKIQINDRMAELEQMALKAQMNPHFIFNSLNSVQQYVIDKDLRGANKFITEFSRLIRLTLDISSRAKISIYEEISYLSTYLELEKTKFEDKFSYSVVVEGDMDPSEWFIPPMILQPYVENSIRHGVRYRHDKLGHIRVSFSLNEQYLICQVEDNGVGRKKAAQYKSEIAIEYQSKGMTLTAKRIEMLNKNQSAPVLIDIEDLENNHGAAGTRVVVRFPVQDAANEI